MAIRIRKCANPKCADIIGISERANKRFCSHECKTKAHNDNNSKSQRTWTKILDKFDDPTTETFTPFTKWLIENYYPPREIKRKK